MLKMHDMHSPHCAIGDRIQVSYNCIDKHTNPCVFMLHSWNTIGVREMVGSADA